jgi:hypothetical protein
MTSSIPVSFVMLSDISLRPCFKSRVDAEFEPRPDFPDLWSESPPRPCFEFRTAIRFQLLVAARGLRHPLDLDHAPLSLRCTASRRRSSSPWIRTNSVAMSGDKRSRCASK